ncbi:MAG: acetyl-CoA carboxylase biotin carboxyl carrier protein [Terriglobales bacterium]
MNAKELKELIEFLIEKDISEFELERGDVKMRLKRGGPANTVPVTTYVAAPSPVAHPAPAVVTHAAPAAPAAHNAPAVAPAPAAEAVEEAELHVVRSPIVGTFYEAPSPGAPPFVKVGDTVHAGQVLCIIEAMKLMNEIEAEVSGTIVKRYVENAQPVEYGQPLFAVRAG